MILASNVDIKNHKADFRCSIHDAHAEGVDLHTQTRWIRGEHPTRIFIRVHGSVLRQGTEAGCLCSTLYCVPGKTEIERALYLAKDNEASYQFEEDGDKAEPIPLETETPEEEPALKSVKVGYEAFDEREGRDFLSTFPAPVA